MKIKINIETNDLSQFSKESLIGKNALIKNKKSKLYSEYVIGDIRDDNQALKGSSLWFNIGSDGDYQVVEIW